MSQSVFPASFAQQRLWFLDQLDPGTAAYNLPRAFRILGPLNVDNLTRAFQLVIERHAALRTVFDSVEGEGRQIVLSEPEVEIPVVDVESFPNSEREDEALRIAAEEGRKPFDLKEGPLIRPVLVRLEPEKHFLVLTMHHIIADGWSIALLFREVTTSYAAITKEEAPDLPELPLQYTEYAQWQREYMSGDVLSGEIDFWKRKLAGAQPLLELPLDHARPTTASWNGATEQLDIPAATLAKLKGLAQAESSTLFMVAMAAFQTLLWRYANQESILIGTPIAGRNDVDLENMIGLFVNTLIFRGDFSANLNFRDLVRQVRGFALEAYAHQELPFEKLVEELVPQRSLDTHPLFQVLFTFQNIPQQVFDIPGLTVQEMPFEAGIAKFDISVVMWEAGDLHCQFEYNTDLFESSTIKRMLEHFERLLNGVVENPDLAVAKIPLMSPKEREQIVVEWNRTGADYPRDLTIPSAFERQVEHTPDATALSFAGTKWTYRQVNDAANRLAQRLVENGTGTSSLVGVCLERSAEMVTALLGVLKTGAAYVPLDPAYPAERLKFLIEDASLSSVVTRSSLQDLLPENVRHVLFCDDGNGAIGEPTSNPSRSVASDQRAYVIYTSGSTGTPKGVEGTHRASMNRFSWMWRTYPFRAGEVCCQKTNLGFVDSIWEIFGPLLAGIPNVIVPHETARDPEEMLQLLASERVTRIVLVPSLLRTLLDRAPNLQRRVPDLKLWTCSGEVLPVDLVKRFREGFPDAVLLNIYGSSEVAADVTCHQVTKGKLASSVAIGKPISNTQIYLVDEYRNPVPIGMRGQIFVGGDNLARGYLNRPELTADRFVSNWLAPELSPRLYRTGDLGRFRGNGEIEYLGRVDSQVKLRGLRIELGEIESVINSHASVQEAVVMVGGEGEQQKLAAYLVMHDTAKAEPSAGELRRYLRTKLPEHMVPASYWQVEALPLLPSGKVNRSALAGVGGRPLQDQEELAAPRNEVEAKLAEIWQELLEVEKVGIEQNFFELGGHSLLVLQVAARIRRIFDVELPVRSVFEAPTISRLAMEVQKAEAMGLKARTPILQRRPRSPSVSRETLLAQLDGLSSAELQNLLQRVIDGKQPA
ncbi:MAG TPA: amino acid adenylation domain-containing protein [Candidatus Sulfotelmatobacter sp.]|nr:amino acid adenylation domain-containing protein [Candidatus Sulfotelmatobacter sp.]